MDGGNEVKGGIDSDSQVFTLKKNGWMMVPYMKVEKARG